MLRFINNQTEKICLEAVKQNGSALQYVKNQTEKICLEAVKQNRYTFDEIFSNQCIGQYVDLTYEINRVLKPKGILILGIYNDIKKNMFRFNMQ